MLHQASLSLLILIVSTSANAFLFVEPFAQYDISGTDQDYTIRSSGVKRTEDYLVTYQTFGARAGYSFDHLYFGGMASKSTGTMENGKNKRDDDMFGVDVSGTSFNLATRNNKRTMVGGFIGVKFGSKATFRMWATYLKSSLTSTNALSSADIIKRKGQGFALGFGIAPASFISLNFQMQGLFYDSENGRKYHYDEVQSDGEIHRVAAYREFGYVFSISFPIGLLYATGG